MDQIEYLRNLKVWVFLFRLKYKSAISGVSMEKSSNSMDLNGAARHCMWRAIEDSHVAQSWISEMTSCAWKIFCEFLSTHLEQSFGA